jgi:hypothetical protein
MESRMEFGWETRNVSPSHMEYKELEIAAKSSSFSPHANAASRSSTFEQSMAYFVPGPEVSIDGQSTITHLEHAAPRIMTVE